MSGRTDYNASHFYLHHKKVHYWVNFDKSRPVRDSSLNVSLEQVCSRNTRYLAR